ncbi:hypothetical protein [Nonomuraea polychroma]|uniref:hypothetical protein n=1 Tax=Nonomuraea polychroma TaxID=46176 RepID=UPI000FDE01CF|nr:hypothetical protein [Nonomuraea polychroma]
MSTAQASLGASSRTSTHPGRRSTAIPSPGNATESFARLSGLLRCLVRTAEGRDPELDGRVIVARRVKTSANVSACNQSYDEGKKIAGRNRSIVTDPLSLLIAVLLTATTLPDGAAGLLCRSGRRREPNHRQDRAGSACRTKAIQDRVALDVDAEVVRRDPATCGFTAFCGVGRSSELRAA